jgi:hypothetical protein
MMYCAVLSLVARFSIDENTLLASQALKVMVFWFLRIRLDLRKGGFEVGNFPAPGELSQTGQDRVGTCLIGGYRREAWLGSRSNESRAEKISLVQWFLIGRCSLLSLSPRPGNWHI